MALITETPEGARMFVVQGVATDAVFVLLHLVDCYPVARPADQIFMSPFKGEFGLLVVFERPYLPVAGSVMAVGTMNTQSALMIIVFLVAVATCPFGVLECAGKVAAVATDGRMGPKQGKFG